MTTTSLPRIVRFTVAEETLHRLLSGNPERRRTLRDINWGSRDAADGQVLITPPLLDERAAEVRALFDGVEGVTEVDASGEYKFAYTAAPEVYDGHGTLSLAAAGNERLVAIRKEHVHWQASRYASGLHLFRPVEPEPESPEPPSADPPPEDAAPPPSPPPPALGVDTVVHFLGRTRRYVIVRIEVLGGEARLSMIALSGAVRGCAPTAVPAAELERDADQTVAFTGAAARTLKRKYDDARQGIAQAPLPIAS